MPKVQWSLRSQLVCFLIVCILVVCFARSSYERYHWSKLETYWLGHGAVLTRVENGTPMLVINDSLSSSGVPFSTEKLEKLSGIDGLGYLFISSATIADIDVRVICDQKLPALVALSLNNTAISDDALKYLRKLKRLNRLHLKNTNVTDNAIDNIASMDGLVEISIQGTQITPDGLAKLKSLKPNVRVNFD